MRRALRAGIGVVLGLSSGCEVPGDVSTESRQQPIYQGTVDTNPHRTGTVKISGICTGALVNKNWALTAKHCIGPVDTNGDRLIHGWEGAGNVTIGNGPNSAGNAITLTADLIVLHSVQDTALVRVPNPGFDTSWLPGDLYDFNTPPFSWRGVRFMKISQTPTINLAVGQQVFRRGYAAEGSDPFGTLRHGWTTVSSPQPGWYVTPGGPGSTCPGDSGGPDYAWLNHPQQPSGWYHIGIHINGACNLGSSMDGTAELRQWIIQAADAYGP